MSRDMRIVLVLAITPLLLPATIGLFHMTAAMPAALIVSACMFALGLSVYLLLRGAHRGLTLVGAATLGVVLGVLGWNTTTTVLIMAYGAASGAGLAMAAATLGLAVGGGILTALAVWRVGRSA